MKTSLMMERFCSLLIIKHKREWPNRGHSLFQLNLINNSTHSLSIVLTLIKNS
jgi:hypothetical protein